MIRGVINRTNSELMNEQKKGLMATLSKWLGEWMQDRNMHIYKEIEWIHLMNETSNQLVCKQINGWINE